MNLVGRDFLRIATLTALLLVGWVEPGKALVVQQDQVLRFEFEAAQPFNGFDFDISFNQLDPGPLSGYEFRVLQDGALIFRFLNNVLTTTTFLSENAAVGPPLAAGPYSFDFSFTFAQAIDVLAVQVFLEYGNGNFVLVPISQTSLLIDNQTSIPVDTPPTLVPVPATLPLLLAGVAGIGALRRAAHKRRAKS